MSDVASARLLDGEKVLVASDDGILVLTNARVRFDERGVGSARYVSIMHPSISSCGLVTKSNPVLLTLGGAAILFGLVMEEDVRVFSWLTAVVLTVAYFWTRKSVLKISSNGGDHITVPTTGMGRSAVLDFLDQVDGQRFVAKDRDGR